MRSGKGGTGDDVCEAEIKGAQLIYGGKKVKW